MSNAPNSRLKGRHTSSFTNSIPQCITVLKNISPGRLVDNDSLSAFHKMSKILAFVIIDDFNLAKHVLLPETHVTTNLHPEEIANAMIATYEDLSEKFQKSALASFLTNHTSGDRETFYAHVLKRYIPSIMKDTYKRYQLGIRIQIQELHFETGTK